MISVFDENLHSISLADMDVPTAAALEMALIDKLGTVKSDAMKERLEAVLECLDSAISNVSDEHEIFLDMEMEP